MSSVTKKKLPLKFLQLYHSVIYPRIDRVITRFRGYHRLKESRFAVFPNEMQSITFTKTEVAEPCWRDKFRPKGLSDCEAQIALVDIFFRLIACGISYNGLEDKIVAVMRKHQPGEASLVNKLLHQISKCSHLFYDLSCVLCFLFSTKLALGL